MSGCRYINVTPSPRLVKTHKQRGPVGPAGPPGGTVFIEITENHVAQPDENGTYFVSTDTDDPLEIDFQEADPISAYGAVVATDNGIVIVNPGTIIMSGQTILGNVSSTLVGSMAWIIVLNDTTLLIQNLGGAWEYE